MLKNSSVNTISIIVRATGSVLLIIASVWIFILALDRNLPISNAQVVVQTPVVKKGANLLIVNRGIRTRLCSVEINRLVFDANNNAIYNHSEKREINGMLGPFMTKLKIPIPNDETVALGKATLQQVLHWQCPNNLVQKLFPLTFTYRPVQFKIIAP